MGKTRFKRRRFTNKRRTYGGKNKDNCQLLDTGIDRYTSNSVWKTCIRQNDKKNVIYYIIPNNAILKDIYTIRDPIFKLKHNGEISDFSIEVENQSVSCFLYIQGEWYVLAMINFSVFEYFHYYKLAGVKTLYNKNGTIMLKNAKMISPNKLNITNATPVLKDNKEIYELMNNFVTQKIVASSARELPIDIFGFEVLDNL